MRRLLIIAVREYLAYVRTAGFWISLCLTPVGLSLGFLGPALLARSEPPPKIAVIDLTGEGFAGEIMGGKILGVAAVTATVLTTWALVGGVLLGSANPGLFHDVVAVLLSHGLIAVFVVYLVGGYLIYASLFVAIGAHCETNREAQTLLAPMMMLTTIPVIFMSQAIVRPDSPAIALLSWFPPFTPFLAPARAAADPSLAGVLGTMALTALAAAASLHISGRAFRAGALSSGRGDGRSLFLRVFRPQAEG